MHTEEYKTLVDQVADFIREQGIENEAHFLNDLKFDTLNLLYETDNGLMVLTRGVDIKPFSKEELARNLAKSSDAVSDEAIADVLDTEEIIQIVDGVVASIKEAGKNVVTSDQVFKYTEDYLEEHGYNLALTGYGEVNAREDRKYED